MRRLLFVPLAVIAAFAVTAGALSAQCALQPIGTGFLNGVRGRVSVMLPWDPDGAGPLPESVVVAGSFDVAGDQVTDNIAAYTPSTGTWRAFGAGVAGTIRAMAVLPSGDLVIAGTMAGRVARWNGSAWQPLGGGLAQSVASLCVLPNGDLAAGGAPQMIAGSPERVVRWNGSSWAPLGSFTDIDPRAMVVLPNGDLVVAGASVPGAVTAPNNIARWNGTTWSALGAGTTYPIDFTVLLPNGDLIVCGLTQVFFIDVGYMERWNGTAWSPFAGGNMGGPVSAIAALSTGEVLASVTYQLPTLAQYVVNRSNGSGWTTIQSPDGPVLALQQLAGGQVAFGGSFQTCGVPARSVALGTASGATASLGTGFDGAVARLQEAPNGDLVAAGGFRALGGNGVAYIARFDGTAWAPIGTGLPGEATALAVMPDATIVAGGFRPHPSGGIVPYLERWDGATWRPMQASYSWFPYALAAATNGDLLAAMQIGGSEAVARWDGTTWTTIGTMAGGEAFALLPLPNGELVVGGSFTTIGGVAASRIARWNGAAWLPLGTGVDGPVASLVLRPDGSVIAGGAFANAGGQPAHLLARWDGATWSAIAPPFVGTGPGPSVGSLANLPNGDLAVGGAFTAVGSVPAGGLARWDGATWSNPVGGTFVAGPGLPGAVAAMALRAGAELFVAGDYSAPGEFLPALVRLQTPCPASTTSISSSCSGSVGPVTLAATRAWIGGPCRFTADGFGANSVAVWALGVPQAPQPLQLPLVAPGCTIATTLDYLGFQLPVNGIAGDAIVVPRAPALIGVTAARQVADAEFDAGGNLVLIASSNALALTIGAF